jgi:ABC-type uncharacterized transport system substrate-binding protein
MARAQKILALIGSLLIWATAASSHPHVFLDGGVVFIVDDDAMLRDVAVTWRYDAFETLYILTDMGFASAPENDFSPAERTRVEERLSYFADDFDGSVHLTAGTVKLELEWPRDLSARMVGDRLEITFYRKLVEPLSLAQQEVTAEFYERTYFYALSMTDQAQTSGTARECAVEFIPFVPAEATQNMLEALAQLDREETPDNTDIGSYFADKAIVSCARA